MRASQENNATGTHVEQIKNRAQELKAKVNTEHTVFCIRYSSYSARAFFIISSPKNINHIKNKIKSFLDSNWGQFWGNYFEC